MMLFSTPRLAVGDFAEWDGRGPWIFTYAPPGLNCTSNPDIAGSGVVLSGVIASLFTTLAAVLIFFLDSRYLPDRAMDLVSQIHRPQQYPWPELHNKPPYQECCFPYKTQVFSDSGLTRYATRAGSGQSKILPTRWRSQRRALARYARCRLLLATAVTVLADAQAFIGIVLLMSVYINLPQVEMSNASLLDFQDNYFTLAVYLACLSSSSHLAALQVLKIDAHKTTTLIRVCVIVSFAIFLTVTIDLSRYCFQPGFILMERVLVYGFHMSKGAENVLEYLAPPIIMFWVFFVSVAQLLEPMRNWIFSFWLRILRYLLSPVLNWLKNEKLGEKQYKQVMEPVKATIHTLLFTHPVVVLSIQVIFAGISVTCALLQKFTPAPLPTASDIAKGVGAWCSLNNPQDNAWTFGQTSALILLIVPVYSTIHTFLDSNRKGSVRVDPGDGDMVVQKGEMISPYDAHTRSSRTASNEWENEVV